MNKDTYIAKLEIDYIVPADEYDLSSMDAIDHIESDLRSTCFGDFSINLDSIKIIGNKDQPAIHFNAETTYSFDDFEQLNEKFTDLDFGDLIPHDYLNLTVSNDDKILFEGKEYFKNPAVKIEEVLDSAKQECTEKGLSR